MTDPKRDDENVTDAGDVSPHYGGRAQPGDVLGIETGGETTGIGDTAEDEDERRRDALEEGEELDVEEK
jgi:cation transport regulator ChaC